MDSANKRNPIKRSICSLSASASVSTVGFDGAPAPGACFFLIPLTMSSILRSMLAASMAVLKYVASCYAQNIGLETGPIITTGFSLQDDLVGRQAFTFSMPSIDELFCFKAADTVNSVAPPPGRSFGFFIISLLAPLKSTVQAFGSLQSTMKAKNSSPIFLTSNNPALVPTSDSCSSSGLFTITAPHALAILLLSVFLNLLIALTPCLHR
ncbi:hypothetical protein CFP56_020354 [Quercus suber]|uniref:Uncharacterized protein n=1 Tax=Quercus suber TaxID=58331 RepID=A0AAW0KHI2_QUESU